MLHTYMLAGVQRQQVTVAFAIQGMDNDGSLFFVRVQWVTVM